MYRTILVPLDGSPWAERALPVAGHLAAQGDARVILLRAVVGESAAGIDVPPVHANGRTLRDAQDYLSRMADNLDGVDIVETAAFHGDAADAVLEEIRVRKVDLVVMATHARARLDRLVHGSVAQTVLSRTRVPVLLVHDQDARYVEHLPQPPRLLVPLDGSTFAEQALPVALDLAAQLKADVVLTQSTPPPDHVRVAEDGTIVSYVDQQVESAETEARQYLTEVARELDRRIGPPTHVDVRIGPPAGAIAQAAREHSALFVVMATHGRTSVTRLLLGSVAEAVVRNSSVPVLLVRPRDGRDGEREALRQAHETATSGKEPASQ